MNTTDCTFTGGKLNGEVRPIDASATSVHVPRFTTVDLLVQQDLNAAYGIKPVNVERYVRVDASSFRLANADEVAAWEAEEQAAREAIWAEERRRKAELAEERAAIQQRVDGLTDPLSVRIAAIHADDGDGHCEACDCYNPSWVDYCETGCWPCATIRALFGEAS